MPIPIWQVDAFAEAPFAGNPAAVCLMEHPAPDAWLQAMGAENNLAETAFVWREGDAFRLRWFTPGTEVDLCGHATLATAHVLWESGWLARGEVARFHTRSGLLEARPEGDAIVLDFPADPATVLEPAEYPTDIAAIMGVKPLAIARIKLGYLIEVSSEREVLDARPDFRRMPALGRGGCIITAQSDRAGIDFVSRFFAPAEAIDEDPVTGSAHCALAPWWSAKLGASDMTGFQASRRGGRVGVRLRGDRVELVGKALTVLRGELADDTVAMIEKMK